MNTIETLESPFKHLVMTIGELPTTFVESMSYYETIAWLVDYIKNKVIPPINNNAEAIKEIQAWISTLDLQDEVDNKLDEMAESGQLADIIAQYLNLAGVLAYDNIADMAAAENLVDGSICRVLGNVNYQDGNGAFYKVRSVTSGDVVDGLKIVAITNAPTLIAERINDTPYRKFVFVGDSYSQGYTPDGSVTSWSTLLVNKLGLTNGQYKIVHEGGAGFTSTGHLWSSLINNQTADNDVTDVVIAGGYNDRSASNAAIRTGIHDTKLAIQSKYPNAKIYVAFIGGCTTIDHSDMVVREYGYSRGCVEENITYLPNLLYILYNANFFSSDGIHPNADGQSYLADGLYAALNGGYNFELFTSTTVSASDTDFDSVGGDTSLFLSVDNATATLRKGATSFYSVNTPITINYNTVLKIGKIRQFGVIGSKYVYEKFVCNVILRMGTDNPYSYAVVPCAISIDKDGYVNAYMQPVINDTGDNYKSFTNVNRIEMPAFAVSYMTKDF